MQYEAAKALLVKQVATANRRQVATLLELGRLATVAIRTRLRTVDPAARSLERARTVADLRTATASKELSRWIRCYGTGQAFDLDTAKELPIATLRAFGPLVKRNGRNETWAIKAKHRDFALQLWAGARTETAATIAAAIANRLGTRPAPAAAPKPKHLQTLHTILDQIDELSPEEQRTIARLINERLSAMSQVPLPQQPKHSLSFFTRKAS